MNPVSNTTQELRCWRDGFIWRNNNRQQVDEIETYGSQRCGPFSCQGMAKLTNIRSNLSSLPSRVASSTDKHGHDRGGRGARSWYNSKEWKRLKQAAHLRDNFTCQRTGTLCVGRGNDWNAPIANHKIPHRGRRELFFDLNNIETVTKKVHDTLIQREEHKARTNGDY